MNLEKFVSSALVQIVNGVAKAQQELRDTGAVINPGLSSVHPSGELPVIEGESGLRHYVRHVSFDVAVTAGDEQSAGAGAGITVFGARLGGEGRVSYENSTVSRVQFVIPLALPMVNTANEAEALREGTRPLNYPTGGIL